jgi:hypothetical protein
LGRKQKPGGLCKAQEIAGLAKVPCDMAHLKLHGSVTVGIRERGERGYHSDTG